MLKCYICNCDLIEKETSININKGQYNITITGLHGYVCPECGETIYDTEEVKMIQDLSWGLVESDSDKPDILNVSETADLLRLSKQSVYNMLKDGKLRAKKVGREWRFLRKEVLSLIEDSTQLIAARSDGSDISEKDKEVVRKELEEM